MSAKTKRAATRKRVDSRPTLLMTAELCGILADILERNPEARAGLVGIYADRHLKGEYRLEILKARMKPKAPMQAPSG